MSESEISISPNIPALNTNYIITDFITNID